MRSHRAGLLPVNSKHGQARQLRHKATFKGNPRTRGPSATSGWCPLWGTAQARRKRHRDPVHRDPQAEVVPTWNYGAVHAYGNAKVFPAPEDLLKILHELIPTFEAAYAAQFASLSQAYRDRMLSHIVGFEIAVTKLEAKFKLSQNRTKDEQQNIIESLSTSNDTAVSGTARLMCEQGLGVKK